MSNEQYNAWKREHRKTFIGLTGKMYAAQKDACKKRNHDMPNYTLDQFRDWLESQPVFFELYEQWLSSDCKKDLIPSADRLDNDMTYSLDNLQVVTFKKNRENVYADRRSGIVTTIDKPVLQFAKDGEFIAEYFSIAEASRVTGVKSQNISAVANKLPKRKSAGGYIWKFKESK